jgi:hypothetical protein
MIVFVEIILFIQPLAYAKTISLAPHPAIY